jgi:hypothetical protein
MKIAAYLILFIALVFALDYGGILWQSVTAPKREEVRREVFEQTKSYREGKRQELVRYRLQYMRATTNDEREAIASTVRLSMADVNPDELNPELKQFLDTCNGVQQ